uniref:Uncharacterized protein n=1 Tax=Lutzomyia longipalpis TaxID=7200 RepID=A0A1B0CGE8_LUTLO
MGSDSLLVLPNTNRAQKWEERVITAYGKVCENPCFDPIIDALDIAVYSAEPSDLHERKVRQEGSVC